MSLVLTVISVAAAVAAWGGALFARGERIRTEALATYIDAHARERVETLLRKVSPRPGRIDSDVWTPPPG